MNSDYELSYNLEKVTHCLSLGFWVSLTLPEESDTAPGDVDSMQSFRAFHDLVVGACLGKPKLSPPVVPSAV